MSIEKVKEQAVKLAIARKNLHAVAEPFVKKLKALQAQFLKKTHRLAQVELLRKEALMKVLAQSEHEFVDKKSLEVLGVKCGFRMSAEKITVGELAVDQIIEHGDAERFLRTVLAADKQALAALTDEQLARIDCARVKSENKAFCAPDTVLDGIFESLGHAR